MGLIQLCKMTFFGAGLLGQKGFTQNQDKLSNHSITGFQPNNEIQESNILAYLPSQDPYSETGLVNEMEKWTVEDLMTSEAANNDNLFSSISNYVKSFFSDSWVPQVSAQNIDDVYAQINDYDINQVSNQKIIDFRIPNINQAFQEKDLDTVKKYIEYESEADIGDVTHFHLYINPLERKTGHGYNNFAWALYGRQTYLGYLVEENNFAWARLYLELGANVNLGDKFSPLHDSLMKLNPEMVKLLIDYEADVHFENPKGNTVLDGLFDFTNVANRFDENHLKIGKLLIEAGADFTNIKDNACSSLLHKILSRTSLQSGNEYFLEIIETMIKADQANLNLKESFGKRTLLGIAVEQDLTDIVRLLIENGADVKMQSADRDLLEIANSKKKPNRDIIELLNNPKTVKNNKNLISSIYNYAKDFIN